jgi:predicted glycoside hydrolase/deacetylase ChbG (UPF0249 family)
MEARPAARRIWLCADDYGIAPGVNAAIRDLVARSRLNATSVMVLAPTFSRVEADSLAQLNAARRRVAIGLHVTLTQPFQPLTPGYRPVKHGAFPSLGMTLGAALARRLDSRALATEIAAQFEAFANAFGCAPDFVDGHQHVQLFPQVREAFLATTARLAPNAWVRQSGSAAPLRLADPKGLLIDRLSRSFRARTAAAGIATNSAFAGTYTFRVDADFAAEFPRFLDGLPDGGVIMCHPGFVDAELARLDPLTTLREREYAYFVSDAFPAALEANRVALA